MGRILKILSGLVFLGILIGSVFDLNFFYYMESKPILYLLFLSVSANLLFLGLIFDFNNLAVEMQDIKDKLGMED